jgi:adenosine deaminase
LPKLLEAGLRCTVSTDDTLFFANSLHEEYRALADHMGFSRDQLLEIARNGWEAAHVRDDFRQKMLRELDDLKAACSAAG